MIARVRAERRGREASHSKGVCGRQALYMCLYDYDAGRTYPVYEVGMFRGWFCLVLHRHWREAGAGTGVRDGWLTEMCKCVSFYDLNEKNLDLRPPFRNVSFPELGLLVPVP